MDEHTPDSAFQLHSLKTPGVDIQRVHIMHIDNEYEQVAGFELPRFFTFDDVTDEVLERVELVPDEVEWLLKVLQLDTPPMLKSARTATRTTNVR